jgi:hypothetical protein
MKGTFSAFLRRPVIIAIVTVSLLATSVSSVGATSVTTTTISSAQRICGVVPNPSVRVVSKGSPCVISVRRGGNVRIEFRSGFRWGYPVSNSKSVVVRNISRDSIGVIAVILHAAATGHALIRTTGTVYCKTGRVCPDLALLWSLKVTVTKAAST